MKRKEPAHNSLEAEIAARSAPPIRKAPGPPPPLPERAPSQVRCHRQSAFRLGIVRCRHSVKGQQDVGMWLKHCQMLAFSWKHARLWLKTPLSWTESASVLQRRAKMQAPIDCQPAQRSWMLMDIETRRSEKSPSHARHQGCPISD